MLSAFDKFASITCRGSVRNVSYKMKSKHWNPKYKYARQQKYKYIELIDTDVLFDRQKLTTEEIRSQMKRKGVLPYRPYMEKPMHISSTAGVYEPYVPIEGDGKSFDLKNKIKEQYEEIVLKGRSMLDVQKLKRIEPNFSLKTFPSLAQEIYIKAHEALVKYDEKELHDLVTEKAYIDMTHGLEYCTMKWDFIESLEPPRIVHARVFPFSDPKAPPDFAQITVRFFTKQRLAIYDRFGRLFYGNSPFSTETTPTDVLEYVVFENHIVDTYGKWRLHAKIIPDWMKDDHPSNKQNKSQVISTFIQQSGPSASPHTNEQNNDTIVNMYKQT